MFDKHALTLELNFKAIRSSGAGGQHVNKVSSKIELTFNIQESLVFDEAQKARLLNKLSTKFTKEGLLIMQCDETRSQRNKTFFCAFRKWIAYTKKTNSNKNTKSGCEKAFKD